MLFVPVRDTGHEDNGPAIKPGRGGEGREGKRLQCSLLNCVCQYINIIAKVNYGLFDGVIMENAENGRVAKSEIGPRPSMQCIHDDLSHLF